MSLQMSDYTDLFYLNREKFNQPLNIWNMVLHSDLGLIPKEFIMEMFWSSLPKYTLVMTDAAVYLAALNEISSNFKINSAVR